MTETRTLHRKLAQVMYEAERIPKRGVAPREMGGYKFVEVGDAADFIRKALAEHVITMMPTRVQVVGQADRPTKSGGSTTTVDLITDWTLTDGESGESITIQSFGAGADVGDKYSGKASTSAMKYALLTAFLLSTGEDSEGGKLPDRAATHPEDKDEQEVHLGPITRTGVVVKGSGHGTNLEWRETPDGHAIGFLLEVGDGKPKPEVLIEGILGRALFAAMSMDVDKLAGQKVELDGDVFEVHRPKPRKMAYRIRPTRIVTDTWSIPAPAEVGRFDDGQPVELGLDA